MEIESKEINKKYNELSKPFLGPGNIQIIDYNHCVDEIMQYSNEMWDQTKKAEKETEINYNKTEVPTSDISELKIPNLENLDSLLSPSMTVN